MADLHHLTCALSTSAVHLAGRFCPPGPENTKSFQANVARGGVVPYPKSEVVDGTPVSLIFPRDETLPPGVLGA